MKSGESRENERFKFRSLGMLVRKPLVWVRSSFLLLGVSSAAAGSAGRFVGGDDLRGVCRERLDLFLKRESTQEQADGHGEEGPQQIGFYSLAICG
jgi:hypothetical protein